MSTDNDDYIIKEVKTARLKFRSYNYEPLMAAIGDLRRIIDKFPNVKFTRVSLPNKKKYYCVNRSPHVNTNSREQFGVKQVSQIVDLEFVTEYYNTYGQTESYPGGPPTFAAFMNDKPDPLYTDLFPKIKNYNLPPGVFCEVYSEWESLNHYFLFNNIPQN